MAPKLSGKGPHGVIMDDKYSQTPYGNFWDKHLLLKKLPNSLNRPGVAKPFCSRKTTFCKSRPYMAALANPPEAKYSHIDPLSFMFSPKPDQNITCYVNMLTSTPVFLKKHFFSWSLPCINSTQTKALNDRRRSRRCFFFFGKRPLTQIKCVVGQKCIFY